MNEIVFPENTNTYFGVSYGRIKSFKLPGISVLVGHNMVDIPRYINHLNDLAHEQDKNTVFYTINDTTLSSGMIDLLDEIHEKHFAKPYREDKEFKEEYDKFAKEKKLRSLYELFRRVKTGVKDNSVIAIFDYFAKKIELRHFGQENDKNAIHVLQYPENNLHPSLQVGLGQMIVMLQHFLDMKFIVATHSHFLVDAIAEYSKFYKQSFNDVPCIFYSIYCDTIDEDEFSHNLKYNRYLGEFKIDNLEPVYTSFAKAVDKLNELRENNELDEKNRQYMQEINKSHVPISIEE